MAMSTMKDHERLELLKEIGGTKVYEERRKESLKILQETDNRRSRILEVVGHLHLGVMHYHAMPRWTGLACGPPHDNSHTTRNDVAWSCAVVN